MNPLRQKGFGLIAVTALLLLHGPLLAMAVLSLNSGMLFHRWEGVSLYWYGRALANPGFIEAARVSLIVSVSATVLAVGLATLAALGLSRLRGRAEGVALALLGLPLVVPEVVMAIATLILFSQVPVFGQGLFRLILAHACFCLPFALMPVRAALRGLDPHLAQAARDLSAGEMQVLRTVTLPLLAPGIAAGAALAFVVSFDDFAMAQMTAGPGQSTLPVFIWAQLRRPLTPEINAMCMIVLALSVTLVCLAAAALSRRGQSLIQS